MRQCSIALLFSLALGGCNTVAENRPAVPTSAERERDPSYRRPTDAQAIQAARQAIAAQMKDPGTVQFGELIRRTAPNARGEPTDVVCGRINAKNSYGGYTGFKPVVYLVAAKLTFTSEELAGPEAIRTLCG